MKLVAAFAEREKSLYVCLMAGFARYCDHIGIEPSQHLLESRPADFETWIDWILTHIKSKTEETVDQLWRWLCQRSRDRAYLQHEHHRLNLSG
jgi:hypothetical protein